MKKNASFIALLTFISFCTMFNITAGIIGVTIYNKSDDKRTIYTFPDNVTYTMQTAQELLPEEKRNFVPLKLYFAIHWCYYPSKKEVKEIKKMPEKNKTRLEKLITEVEDTKDELKDAQDAAKMEKSREKQRVVKKLQRELLEKKRTFLLNANWYSSRIERHISKIEIFDFGKYKYQVWGSWGWNWDYARLYVNIPKDLVEEKKRHLELGLDRIISDIESGELVITEDRVVYPAKAHRIEIVK